MPVTIRTQPIDADPWPKATTTSAAEALHLSFTEVQPNSIKLMQTSVHPDNPSITPSTNGLVDAAIEAWNTHHHLVLRPDDIWLAVLCQLGFFIDAHASELRHLFVAHDGQKTLFVKQYCRPDQADYGKFTEQMAGEIDKHVVDPTLSAWAAPKFSTTTDTDRVAAAVLLMGAMKSYFSYDFCCVTCGIPSVTLLGERADWEELSQKIDRIPRLGGDAVEFHRLLKPVARHMLLSFDEPASDAVLKFWRVIASMETPRGHLSGYPSEYVTGWITTFCFFRPDGKRNRLYNESEYTARTLAIDGVEYQALSPTDKVTGCGSVPVTVKWIDCGVLIEERKCRLYAGSIGVQPGRHVDLGVVLDGLALPPAEIPDNGVKRWREGKRYRSNNDGRHLDEPQRQGAPKEEGASLDGTVMDAVKPRTGWWMVEEVGSQERDRHADQQGTLTLGDLSDRYQVNRS